MSKKTKMSNAVALVSPTGRSARPAINATMVVAVAPTRVGCSNVHLSMEDIDRIFAWVVVVVEVRRPLPRRARWAIGRSVRPAINAVMDAAVAPTRVGCSSALPWVDIVLTCVLEAAEAEEEEWCPPPLLPLEEVPHY